MKHACKLTVLFLGILLGVSSVCGAHAAERRVALVIGNSKYATMPLRNPANDATDIAAALREVGFTVTLLTDVDQRRMRESVETFSGELRRGGMGLFYFSGHGLQHEGENYLVPVGAKISTEGDVRYEAVPAGWIVQKIEDAGNRLNVVILDACRDNPFARGWRSSQGGLAVMDPGQGMLIAFAAKPGQQASDGQGRNSPYTEHLKTELRQPGLAIEDVFKRVRTAVREETGGKQIPQEWSTLEGMIQFVGKPAEPGAVAPSKPAQVAALPPAAPPAPPPTPPAVTEAGEMVRVPAGEFYTGCNEQVDTECLDNEKPGRRVDVGTFQIDKTEVTVGAYRRCVGAGSCSAPGTGGSCNWEKTGRERHPINCVDWEQARTYCTWAGKRLPSEAEWEKTARGTDGRKYPWGNAGYGAGGLVANIADETAKQADSRLTWAATGYVDGYAETAPVGSFPAGASPYGALDMMGNVWEWTADWSDSEHKDRVVRGGSWADQPQFARASDRFWDVSGNRDVLIGVRCAQ